jgi:hypothetical protein
MRFGYSSSSPLVGCEGWPSSFSASAAFFLIPSASSARSLGLSTNGDISTARASERFEPIKGSRPTMPTARTVAVAPPARPRNWRRLGPSECFFVCLSSEVESFVSPSAETEGGFFLMSVSPLLLGSQAEPARAPVGGPREFCALCIRKINALFRQTVIYRVTSEMKDSPPRAITQGKMDVNIHINSVTSFAIFW